MGKLAGSAGTIAVAIVLASAVGASGTSRPVAAQPVPVADRPAPLAAGGPSRLTSPLKAVAAAASGHGVAAALGQATDGGLRPVQRELLVLVTASSPGAAAAAVQAAGGRIDAGAGGARVQALVAPGSLGALAALPGVVSVASPPQPFTQAVAGQEVTSTHASAWQTAGVTGAGAKVAILDAGFTGLAAAQASGDLPGSVTTEDHCEGRFDSGGVHGVAVAEIVHEVAPDAQLLLACVGSPDDLLAAEQWARAQGAQIINHSVAWFNSARGDGHGGAGTPDAVVADAAAHGVLW